MLLLSTKLKPQIQNQTFFTIQNEKTIQNILEKYYQTQFNTNIKYNFVMFNSFPKIF